LDRAWQLVDGAPPGPVKARVLAQLVRFNMLAARYDADQVREALTIAEALGLDELRAHVLISSGTVRAGQGDERGLDQLAQGLEIARTGNWLFAMNRGATNLGAQREVRGRTREALAAFQEAMRAAERMGSLAQWRLARANLIEPWLESGDWELAGPAADEFLADSERLGGHYVDAAVADVRAALRLARGDFDGATGDVAFALERARVVKDPQILFGALARAVHVHAEAGRPDAARERFDELLALDPSAFRYLYSPRADLAWAATVIDRAEPARRALAIADWPSFRAARAIVDGDFAGAAAIYDEHGAARSAALARLRGGLDDGARGFFARIGATWYAEMYVVPSTS
jgi:tetratricopeptide (TPR) repeat protein